MSEIAERDILLNLKFRAFDIKSKLKKANGDIRKGMAGTKSELKNVNHEIQKQSLAVEKAGLAAKKAQVPFAGYAMSLMFAGMALKSLFDTVWKYGSKTFQEISHSVEGSTTGFDLLEGSMKYLGYQVGAALEPIVGWLIPIIDNLSEWIEKHPALFRFIALFTGIAGTLFMVGGMTKLAYDGFKGLVLTIKAVTKASKAFKNIKWSTLTNNINKIKKSFQKIGEYLAGTLKNNINWIKNNPIKSIVGGLVLGGIIMAFLWIVRLKEEMGGWGELFKNVGRGIMNTLAIITAGISAALTMAYKLGYNLTHLKGQQMTVTFAEAYGSALEENLAKVGSTLAPEKGYIDGSRSLKEIWEADLYNDQKETSALVNQQVVLNVESGASVDNEATSRILSSFEQYAQTIGNDLTSR